MPSTRRPKIWSTSAPESSVQTGGIDAASAPSVSVTIVSSGPFGACTHRAAMNGPSSVMTGTMRPLDTVRRASSPMWANHSIESETNSGSGSWESQTATPSGSSWTDETCIVG